MSIKTTIDISIKNAIERIYLISDLIKNKAFKTIKEISYENDIYNFNFRELKTPINEDDDLDNWTNEMIEEIIDKPFFRLSLFENYKIRG